MRWASQASPCGGHLKLSSVSGEREQILTSNRRAVVLLTVQRFPSAGGSFTAKRTACVSGLHRTELDRYTPKSLRDRLAEGRGSDMYPCGWGACAGNGSFGPQWQDGLFVKIEGTIQGDAL
jgi:hypothetical protein